MSAKDTVANKAADIGEKTRETASDAAHAIKDKAQRAADWTREKAGEAKVRLKRSMCQTGQRSLLCRVI